MWRSGRRQAEFGVALLVVLAGVSFGLGKLAPGLLANRCPLGQDVVRPDRTVCELAFGGLWISLLIGALSALVSTALGGLLASLTRLWRPLDAVFSRTAEAFFSLPDVLVVMAVLLAAQTVADLAPAWAPSPIARMVLALCAVGWAGPTIVLRNRIAELEDEGFILAAHALGASPTQIVRLHLLPHLLPFGLRLFLAKVPSAVLAESTISFLGVSQMRPMSLGQYLGASYGSWVHQGGSRIVLPAWGLVVLLVTGCHLAARWRPADRSAFEGVGKVRARGGG